MAKRQFELTEGQTQELKRAYVNCKDGSTRTRFLAVRLYGSGYPTEEVINITGCLQPTLMNWCRSYREEGIEGLKDKRRGGNRAKLTDKQIEELRNRLWTYNTRDLFGREAATQYGQFWTVEDLYRAIVRWYGVEYQSRSSLHRLFDLSGMSFQTDLSLISDTKS